LEKRSCEYSGKWSRFVWEQVAAQTHDSWEEPKRMSPNLSVFQGRLAFGPSVHLVMCTEARLTRLPLFQGQVSLLKSCKNQVPGPDRLLVSLTSWDASFFCKDEEDHEETSRDSKHSDPFPESTCEIPIHWLVE